MRFLSSVLVAAGAVDVNDPMLTTNCKTARRELFENATNCPKAMKCSGEHLCSNVGWNHCNYTCLDTCMCNGIRTVTKSTKAGPVCICPEKPADQPGGILIKTVPESKIDCRQARQSMYPTAPQCSQPMLCNDDQMCAKLSENTCEYSCVSTCPCEESLAHGAARVCPCDLDPFAYHCNVEDGKLMFDVVVPKIKTFHPEHDHRNITLISSEMEERIGESVVKVFGESSCTGEVRDELVFFDNVINGENGCNTGPAEKLLIDGLLYDLWTFSVGFDDHWDIDPAGNEVVKRYGRHWTLQCAVQLEDYRRIDPFVDGERLEEVHLKQTSLPFELKLYTDNTFSTEHVHPIDIGVLSDEVQKVYAQAKVLVDNKFLHVDYCLVRTSDKFENGTYANFQDYRFLEDGCLVENGFIQRNFVMTPTRTSMSEDNDVTTNVEQFEVDLWDVSINDDTWWKTYHFECRLIGCDRLNSATEEYCAVSPVCPNRYDNLDNVLLGRQRRKRRDVSTGSDAIVTADLVLANHEARHIPSMILFPLISLIFLS